jgi:hypothetical protein
MGFLLLGIIAVCAIALVLGADCQQVFRVVLDVGQNNGAESLPGSAAAGGGGWASCPNSPMGTLPPDQRQNEGTYCNDLFNSVNDAIQRGGMDSPTINKGWDNLYDTCYETGWVPTDPKRQDSIGKQYIGQALLDYCDRKFK